MENAENLIQFKMSKAQRFVLYKFPLIGLWFPVFTFAFLQIYCGKFEDIFSFLFAFVVLSGVPFFGSLYFQWKVRKAKFATMIIIDSAKKEIGACIYQSNENITFRDKDISEIGRETGRFSNMLKFFLIDGTCVSWIDDKTNEKFLEEILKSFGIPIVNKKLW